MFYDMVQTPTCPYCLISKEKNSHSVKCYHFEQHFVKLESIEFHRKYDMFIYSSINMFSFSMGNENGLSLWKN